MSQTKVQNIYIASIVEMIGKALFVFILVPDFGYTAVCYCEPVLWIACSFLVVVPMAKFFLENRRKKLN